MNDLCNFRWTIQLLCASFLSIMATATNPLSAQSSDFYTAFQDYIDANIEFAKQCTTYDCMNRFDFPIIEEDSSGQLTYWNNASMEIHIPATLTAVMSTRENYYANILISSGRRLLLPIKFADDIRQEKFLKTSIGPGFQYTLYDINPDCTSPSLSTALISNATITPSLGSSHVFIYFISISIIFLIILKYSKKLLAFFGDIRGSAIVILLLTSIRLFYSIPELTRPLAHHEVFLHKLNTSIISASLGELFLNMLLFFVITIFLFRTFDDRPIRSRGKYSRWYLLFSGYLLVMFSIISFVYVVKRVMIHSDITFQFDKIYVLDWNTHIFILSILFFLSSLFFLSYLLIKILNNSGARLDERLFVFAIVTMLTYPIFRYFDLSVSAFGFYILVLSILILMDLFVEANQKSISWLVIWLVTIASGTTALLFAHNSVAYFQKGEFLARKLSNAHRSGERQLNNDIANPEDFHWAIYDAQVLEQKSGTISPDIMQSQNIPEIGSTRTIVHDGNRVILYRNSPGTVVVVSKPRNTIIQFISLFSFLFTSLTLVIILIFLLNLYLQFLPESWNFMLLQDHSIRRQIQYVIFSMLIISFATVFAVTSFYLKNHQAESKIEDYNSMEMSLQYLAEYLNQSDINPDSEPLSNWPKFGFNYFLYDAFGQPINNNSSYQFDRAPFSLTNFTTGEIGAAPVISISSFGPSLFQRIPVNGQSYIIGVNSESPATEEQYFINNLLGTLLNLYIFLFIIASSIALAFSDNITKPLLKLREKFSSVKIGTNNERIDWHSRDEVGQLIHEYNMMLEKIEESVHTLAMTEREVAWREMAKQVAHEIKNPLTPMKLSLQHLQIAIKRDPDHAAEIMERAGSTLLEQIENLSRIASEFSNFAKMPKPENKKVVLNDIASSVHDLFRKREDMDINLYIPIDEIYVFGDKHYMTRVLINLLKNATQAIPNNRRGDIEIHVYKNEENAIIKVKDNGTGIPKSIRNKVFQPNFTSKNSGTGLGLAICANIIESFNGKIYFETDEGIGTTFFIEIPLMRMADNFKKEKHVIL